MTLLMLICKPRFWKLFFFTTCTFIIISILISTKPKKFSVMIRDLGYLTRPIWDAESDEKPTTIIIQYYSPGLANSTKLCELHGWRLRNLTGRSPSGRPFKVIDAFIFSIELDLLEIRLKELWPVVDLFLILEADKTFTGHTKSLYLKNALDRFDWAKPKMRYRAYSGLVAQLPPNESPFYNEIKMRKQMASWIREEATSGDLIISSDIDEIPRGTTIALLRTCQDYPAELHLQMTNYLYSFEYQLSNFGSMSASSASAWRPHVTIYESSTFAYHHHGTSTNKNGSSSAILTDAGWHCSFCFRHLTDFIFKMTSFSHADRLTDPSTQADLQTIQRKICHGQDIFDMYPEAYNFKELFMAIGPIPKSTSMFSLPNYVIENKEKFSFLLPGAGACKRTV